MSAKAVLFVCLGNICRSPSAEGIASALNSEGVVSLLDSAGTGSWHIGEPPHLPMQRAALQRGFDISGLRARQVNQEDFLRFDYIVAMDRQNLKDLQRLQAQVPGSRAKLCMLLEYSTGGDVPDPYYGNEQDFLDCFDVIKDGVVAFLQHLKREAAFFDK